MMNLVWFRRDLRVNDNPALFKACEEGTGVIAIHIETPVTWSRHHMGRNQERWLKKNLDCLACDLLTLGIHLYRLKTDYFSECPDLILRFIRKHDLRSLFYNLEYEWDERARDERVMHKLRDEKIPVKFFHDQCFLHPDQIFNQQGKAYTVFTPYKKACLQQITIEPHLVLPIKMPKKQNDDLLTKRSFKVESVCHIVPGRKAAMARLQDFIFENIENYQWQRDIPDLNATSRLSPYLAIGVLSPRVCIDAIFDYYDVHELGQLASNQGVMTWVFELMWRDFYKMICFQYPHISRNQPFKRETKRLQWHENGNHLEAWQMGQTGVPIIDAAMRQLNQTGWMHNRLRMIVAMYLSKNLWCNWQLGESYFASQLIDWDFSSNNGGWQWSASTGTDAAPYFRIFNPVSQSERFDPDGRFIRSYCPELKGLSNQSIHDPYHRGIEQINYPRPLVDLKATRAYAIEAFKKLKSTGLT